MTLLILEIWS